MNNFTQSFFLFALFWISLPQPSSAGVSNSSCVAENFSDERKSCTCEFYSDGETIRNKIKFRNEKARTNDGYGRYCKINCYHQNVTYELFRQMTTDCKSKMDAVCDKLSIKNCPIFNAPYANLLEALHITLLPHLWIHSGLEFDNRLGPINFKNLTSVKKLDIWNTTFHDSPLDMFSDMPNLISLDLSYGNFTNASQKPLEPNSVPSNISANDSISQKEWFQFPPNLKSLTFAENEPKLRNITKPAFANLTKLEYLNLDNAGIEYLDDNVFDQLKELLDISLDRNNLTRLPADLFVNNRKLKTVSMENAFGKDVINLPGGLFANLLENITELDLSNNQLTLIGSISNTIWKTLKVLKLENNRISYLSENAVAQLKTSKTMKTLTLHNNPWQCDCQHQYFVDFLQQFQNTTILDYNNITCQDNGQSILLRKNSCEGPKPNDEEESHGGVTKWVIVTICVIAIIALVVFAVRYRNRSTDRRDNTIPLPPMKSQ